MSDKSRTYIENRYRRFSRFSCNDYVTELCQKWAFECLSVVHRINRKSPVKRWFYGTYLKLSTWCLRFQRRDRDSNPGYLAVQRFSRPPQSTTLPPLQNSFESCLVFQRRCKGRDYFLFCKQKRKKLFGHFMINQKRKIPKLEIVVLKIKNFRES